VQRASIGFRVHSGWAAAITVAGTVASPLVVDRRRVQLVERFTYTFRQPYHTAERMPLRDAAEFIQRVERQARNLARSGIDAMQRQLARAEYEVVGCGLLLSSGRELPALAQILASHALIHAADGQLFRNAISEACARCNVPITAIKEKDLFDVAAQFLRLEPTALKRYLTELGKLLGPPWSQDEKLAAVAAWLSL
jgi:hypothetical protein